MKNNYQFSLRAAGKQAAIARNLFEFEVELQIIGFRRINQTPNAGHLAFGIVSDKRELIYSNYILYTRDKSGNFIPISKQIYFIEELEMVVRLMGY